jgi:hypothetical protein
MKKCISLSVCLCLFINAFTQNTVQDQAIHFNENDIKNSLNSIHPDLLFLEIKEKTELELSEIDKLELQKKPQELLNQKDYDDEDGLIFFVGFGYGPETIFSLVLPKLSFIYFNPTKNENLHLLMGIEGLVSLANSFWLAGDVTFGFKYKTLTIENSFSAFYHPKLDGEMSPSYFHSAYNPKIGVFKERFWLRFGPSFIINQEYSQEEWMPLIERLREGKLGFNFEILVKVI